MSLKAISFATLAACAACSLDETGNMPIFGDGGSSDVLIAPDVKDEPAPPLPCTVAPGACVSALAPGWSLAAFDPTAETACPSNFIDTSAVYEPQAQAGACDCGCAVTGAPACDLGLLQRMVSNDTSCSQTGSLLTVTGPGCTGWPINASTLDAYSKSTPLAPVGGTCTPNAVPSTSNVGSKVGRMCTPPTACVEQLCEGDVPAGLSVCVVHDGVQATCPGGFGPTPRVIGDAVDLSCSACTCDLSTSTCTNASLDIFSDMQCTTKLVTLAVDGTCGADSASGNAPRAFEYHATVNALCASTGPKTATVGLTNQKTICCR